MLALKTARISPILSSTVARYGTVTPMSTTLAEISPQQKLNFLAGKQTPFVICNSLGPFAITAMRFYSNESKPPTTSINLPDKQKVEKYFFRTVAFIWDISTVIWIWSRNKFQKYVLENTTVQRYYGQLLDKMEKSKKN